jgi:hypothetical protein
MGEPRLRRQGTALGSINPVARVDCEGGRPQMVGIKAGPSSICQESDGE